MAAVSSAGGTPNGEIETSASSSSNLGSRHLSSRIKQYLAYIQTWHVWKSILLGQFVSLLNCATGIITQYLTQTYNVNAPTAQSFLNYVLLCCIFTTWIACRPGEAGLIAIMRNRGWKYFLLSFVDVEANFLVVKAYQYTTLTSVQLLDCVTIPTVLVLSCLFLKVRYKIIHILGVCVCLLGIGCVVWADSTDGTGPNGGNDRLLGDMLCLAGSALYGISNVWQEFVVKNYDIPEFLGMLGLFGSVINGIQLAALEREEVATIEWDVWQIVVLLIGFAVVMFLIYVTVPVFMRMASATAFNLSILSCDFYSLVAGVFIFKDTFQFLYLASFGLVIIGVVMYNLQPTPTARRANYREVVDNLDNVELSQGAPSACPSVSGSMNAT